MKKNYLIVYFASLPLWAIQVCTILNLSDLANPVLRYRAAQITSTFENSTTVLQYDYIENIGDGRGYTAGRAGFTSGTGDMLLVVERYTQRVPNNILAKYIPALRSVNGTGSTSGLSGLVADWKTAAQDPIMRQVQDEVADELYFNPAYKIAKDNGVATALGQEIIWDTAIHHGVDGTDGLLSVIRETKNLMGGIVQNNEVAWLNTFLDRRLWHLLNWSEGGFSQDDDSSRSRVAALRSLITANKLNLDLPLTWSVYGDTFTLQ